MFCSFRCHYNCVVPVKQLQPYQTPSIYKAICYDCDKSQSFSALWKIWVDGTFYRETNGMYLQNLIHTEQKRGTLRIQLNGELNSMFFFNNKVLFSFHSRIQINDKVNMTVGMSVVFAFLRHVSV